MPHYRLRALPGTVTVLAVSDDGSTEDLNVKGDPCVTAADLRSVLAELRAQGLPVDLDLDDEIERAVGLVRLGYPVTL